MKQIKQYRAKHSDGDVDKLDRNVTSTRLTNMAKLPKVGEVAFICSYEQSEKENVKFKRRTSGCCFVVLCLANQTGIDLQAAFDENGF
jgi:hypothetical protein